MSVQTLYRWGSVITVLTALIFAAAAVSLVVIPDGGLANPLAPALYYFGLVLTVPTYITIYAAQVQLAGKLGFAGFLLSVSGSTLYSAPIFVLMAGTSGVSTWHDLWGFAMGNILPLGATIFLIGSILLGVATRRAGVFPRNAGLLLIIGSTLWLIAFFIPVPFLLSIANLLSATALLWIGVSIYPRTQTDQISQPA